MTHRVRMALLWGVGMAGALWLAGTWVAVHSELADLLPEGTTATQRLLLTQIRHGTAGRLILMAIDGAQPDDLAAVSKPFGERLRASGSFDFVGNGAQGLRSEDQRRLFEARYLLSRHVSAEEFSVEGLRRALAQRLDDLRSPLAPLIKPTIPADPTGAFLGLLRAWSSWEAPMKHRGVWMSADRSQALLVAETKAPGFDADAQAAVQQDMRTTFREIAGGTAPGARLVMSGPGVFSVAIKEKIEGDAWWLSTVAGTLVLGFLYLSYRSMTLVLLSLIPLTSGVLAGMLAVNGWFGFIHGITLGFGVTLLGVVDDYPIHLFSHLHARDSARAVMQAIWPTMRLGVFTTAIGFASLLLAGFPALAQLGLFAVAGLLTAAAVTRWVLPALVPAGFVPRKVDPRTVAPVKRLVGRQRIVAAAVVLAGAVLLWSDTPLWQTDLAALSPVAEEHKRLDQQLRQALGAPDLRDLLIVEGTSEEEVLERSEAVLPRLESIRAGGAMTGFDSVSAYLPSRRVQQARQAALPGKAVLASRLAEASAGLPFAPGLFTPFLTAVEETRTRAPVDRSYFRGSPLGMKIDSLLLEQGGRWTAVVPLRGVADRASLADTVAGWNQAGVRYVDLKEESNRLMTAYRDRTLWIAGCGGVLIAVVLGVSLQSLRQIGPVLLPIAASLATVVGVVNLSGESLSLFHAATFLLVMGLGLDYALFFHRPEGSEEERARTLFGLLVCSTTTILVFGVLALSRIPVLHAVGMTAAVGSFCCLLFTVMLAGKETHAVA